MADPIKNIFISHIHEEEDEGLNKLKNLIKDKEMIPQDYSINEECIKSRILQSGALIVYISPKTKES